MLEEQVTVAMSCIWPRVAIFVVVPLSGVSATRREEQRSLFFYWSETFRLQHSLLLETLSRASSVCRVCVCAQKM